MHSVSRCVTSYVSRPPILYIGLRIESTYLPFFGPYRQNAYLYSLKQYAVLNVIDLIVCLVLALAVWSGWRQGFIVQVCSLSAIVAGIWLASRFGQELGAWLHLDAEVAGVGGFIAVFVVTILVIAIAGRLIRKLFHFAGFGIADIVLGIVVATVKYLLVLSVLFSAFDALNVDYSLVERRTIEQSKSYRPVMRLSASVLPFLEWVGEQVPQSGAEKNGTAGEV